ncbi:hypothetical protein ALT1000_30006 [Alteromonas macleodii]
MLMFGVRAIYEVKPRVTRHNILKWRATGWPTLNTLRIIKCL